MIDIHELAQLDKITMGSILKESGATFCQERRVKALQNEISNGSVILTHYIYQRLVGYVQHMPKGDDVLYITSVQVHPEYRSGLVLRGLLRKFAKNLDSLKPKLLTSSVHTNNRASISLHRRLGFVEEAVTSDRIKFSCSEAEIAKIIKKFNLNS